jgi:hypothetical protein
MRMTADAFDADIQVVRSALLKLHDSDELIGIDESATVDDVDAIRRHRLPIRRALIDELIEFLDARSDIVDLQVRNGLDPVELFGAADDVEEP